MREVLEMAKVDFWTVEVKYSGSFEDYTTYDLYKMARFKQMRLGEFTPDETKEMPEKQARKYDGLIKAVDAYPSNKLAVVKYSYIREEVE
jgi:hypothetical protein